MELPDELTRESRLSKILAATAFVIIPFIGFFAGMQYGQFIERLTIIDFVITQEKEKDAPPDNWRLYTHIKYGISFLYPNLDSKCCSLPAPLTGKPEKIITLAEKTAAIGTDAPFNGVAFYVDPNIARKPFEEYVADEKKLLLENHLLNSDAASRFSEEVIIVDRKKGVKLRNYSWAPEILYIPLSKGAILSIVKSEESAGSFNETFRYIVSTIRFTDNVVNN